MHESKFDRRPVTTASRLSRGEWVESCCLGSIGSGVAGIAGAEAAAGQDRMWTATRSGVRTQQHSRASGQWIPARSRAVLQAWRGVRTRRRPTLSQPRALSRVAACTTGYPVESRARRAGNAVHPERARNQVTSAGCVREVTAGRDRHLSQRWSVPTRRYVRPLSEPSRCQPGWRMNDGRNFVTCEPVRGRHRSKMASANQPALAAGLRAPPLPGAGTLAVCAAWWEHADRVTSCDNGMWAAAPNSGAAVCAWEKIPGRLAWRRGSAVNKPTEAPLTRLHRGHAPTAAGCSAGNDRSRLQQPGSNPGAHHPLDPMVGSPVHVLISITACTGPTPRAGVTLGASLLLAAGGASRAEVTNG